MLFSKLARLGNELLSRHQNGLAVAALVVAACPLVLMLVLGFRSLSLPGDGAPPAIAWQGEAPAPVYPPPSYRVAKKDDEPAAASIEPEIPSVDWADHELRRQAASCLALDGDLAGALAIVPSEDPDRPALERATEAGHGRTLDVLNEILPQEERRLRSMLDQAGTTVTNPQEGEAPAIPANQGSEARTAAIRRLGRHLPQGAFFRFVVDLHCRLRDRARATDAHVKLILESCFPPASAGRRLYRESTTLRPSPDRSTPKVDGQGTDR
jgi:hypothetical protein